MKVPEQDVFFSLLANVIEGIATQEETAEFNRMLKAHPEWRETAEDHLWMESVLELRARCLRNEVKQERTSRRFLCAAAALAALLAGGALWLHSAQRVRQGQEHAAQTVEMPRPPAKDFPVETVENTSPAQPASAAVVAAPKPVAEPATETKKEEQKMNTYANARMTILAAASTALASTASAIAAPLTGAQPLDGGTTDSTAYGLVEAVMACSASTEYFPFRSDTGTLLTSWGVLSGIGTGITTLTNTAICWAPIQVYNAERYQQTTNVFANLTPNAPYRVQLHSSENYFNYSFGRRYNMLIQGVQVITNLDEWDSYGFKTPFVRTYDTTANSSGKIIVSMEFGTKDNPHYGGLAVFGTNAPTAIKNFRAYRTGGKMNFYWDASRDVLRYYLDRRPADGEGWSRLAALYSAATSYTDNAPDFSADYNFRLIASNGVAAVTNEISSSSSFPVYAINAGADTASYSPFCPNDYYASPADLLALAVSGQSVKAGESVNAPYGIFASSIYSKDMSWTFPNLRAGKTYKLLVFHSEMSFNTVTARIWSVACNGVTLTNNLDSYALNGGKNLVGTLSLDNLAPDTDNKIAIRFQASTNYASPLALELLENASTGIPLLPTVDVSVCSNSLLRATAVKPHSATADLRYMIRRKAAGADDATAVMLASNIENQIYFDLGIVSGYVYSVQAQNDTDVSGWTDWQAPVSTRYAYKAIHCNYNSTSSIGGGLYGSFDGMQSVYHYPSFLNVSANRLAEQHNFSDAWHPAPHEVYHYQAYTPVQYYRFSNLLAGARYTVRVHTSEDYVNFVSAGARVFSLAANEKVFADSFDPWARTLEQGKVIILETEATADNAGCMTLRAMATVDQASLAGVECILEGSEDSDGLLMHCVSPYTAGGTEDRQTLQQSVSTLAEDWSTVQPSGTDKTGNLVEWAGTLTVPTTGSYTFKAIQAGFFTLWIDQSISIHKASTGDAAILTTNTASITLSAGSHVFFARHIQGASPLRAKLLWSSATIPETTLGAPYLSHTAGTQMDLSPWHGVQIGNTSPGYVTRHYDSVRNTNCFYVVASGADIWASTDQEYFTFQPVPAGREFILTAKVRDTNITHDNSKIGVGIRSTLNSSVISNYVFTANLAGKNKFTVNGADLSAASSMNLLEPYANTAFTSIPPVWLRWETSFTSTGLLAVASSSVNGSIWVKQYSVLLPKRAKQTYAGFNVCSHTGLGWTDFEDVSLTLKPPKGTVVILR